ncbi:uncharacterized protein [Amphiura filiformis]|uniref:uncharacterized protein n=1 Tax=Amphiura filiformis TaxID=82378 RepID=UPI003B224307
MKCDYFYYLADTVRHINDAIVRHTIEDTGTGDDIIAVQGGEVPGAPLLFAHLFVNMVEHVLVLGDVLVPIRTQATDAKHQFADLFVNMVEDVLVLGDVLVQMGTQGADAKHLFARLFVRMVEHVQVLSSVLVHMSTQGTDAKHLYARLFVKMVEHVLVLGDVLVLMCTQGTDAKHLYARLLVKMVEHVLVLGDVLVHMVTQGTGAKHLYVHLFVKMEEHVRVLGDVLVPMCSQGTDAKHLFVHLFVKMVEHVPVLGDVPVPMSTQATDAKHLFARLYVRMVEHVLVLGDVPVPMCTQGTDAKHQYVHHIAKMVALVLVLVDVHVQWTGKEPDAKNLYVCQRVRMVEHVLVLGDVHVLRTGEETDAKHQYVHHNVKMVEPVLVLDDVHVPQIGKETIAKHLFAHLFVKMVGSVLVLGDVNAQFFTNVKYVGLLSSICFNHMSICSPQCQHGGTCSSPGRCTCTSDWEGGRCQEPVCLPRCENGGICTSPWVCTCTHGYVGSACEQAVEINCPDNISIPTDEGVNYTSVNWTEPQPQGGDGLVYTDSSHKSGLAFYLGATTVAYLVHTAGQRIVAQCNFSINVIDIEVPKVTCPNDTNILIGPDISVIVTWDQPECVDNSGYVNVSSTHNSGDMFIVGDTVVVYQAKDASNNINNCSFIVQVEVVNITCPNTKIIPVDKAIGSSCVFWDLPALTIAGERVEIITPDDPDNMYNIEVIEIVSFTSDTSAIAETDMDGSKATDISLHGDDLIPVTIVATKEPTTIINDHQVVESSANGPSTTKDSYIASGFFRSEFVESEYYDMSTGTEQNEIEVTIASTVEDDSTYSSGLGRLITGTNEDDSIETWTDSTGYDELTFVTSANYEYETEVVTELITSVNDDMYTFTFSGHGDWSTVYPKKLGEMTTTASPNVKEEKHATTPADLNVPDSSVEFESVTVVPAFEEDDRIEVIASHNPGDLFGIGVTKVNYSVFEIANSTLITNCSFDVEVIAVDISCPADIHKPIDAQMLSTIVSWKPPNATGGEGLVKVIENHSPEDQFPVGSTRVIYDVLDDKDDHVTSCYFNIYIYAVSIVCPDDVLNSTEPARDFTHVYWNPARIVGNDDYISISSTHNSGDSFQIGPSVVAYEVRSVVSNEIVTNCTFGVLISDIEIPTISCPADILIFVDVSIEPNVTWEAVNATDNSGYFTINCTHTSGAVFSVGLYKVICSSWDPYGNRNRCNFNVHIEGVEIKCPKDIRTVIDKGSIMATVTWDHPDVIGGLNRTNLTFNENPGDKFPVGRTVIEYIVYSPMSQVITSCNFTIAVFDPDIPTLFCPDDVYELTEKDKPKQVFWDLPELFDFSGTATLTYRSHTPGIVFYEGSTMVEYEATDFTGKTGNCTFTVEVIGVQIICPRNVHTVTDFRSAYGNVTWNAPEVFGGEGLAEINVTGELWQEFPIGHSLLTYDVFDSDGKVVTNCTFEVQVEDTEAPVIICPADVLVLVELQFTPSVYWNIPYVTDNSDVIIVITSTYKSGDIFQIGSTNVTYNVEDGFGNTNACSFNVFVQEVSMDCPSDFNVTTSRGLAYAITVMWPQPVIHGYAGELDVISTRPLRDSFVIGKHVVTYTASDGTEFKTKCNFSITVYDEECPIIVCPEDVIDLVEPHVTPKVSWSTPYVTDNSGVIRSIASTSKPGDEFQIGSTNVSYTVQDAAGNMNECIFQVIVEAVRVICPKNINRTTDFRSAFANVTWDAPEVIGGKGLVEMNVAGELWQQIAIGDTAITYHVYDTDGTVVTYCTFDIHVDDVEKPVIICPKDVLVLVEPNNTPSVAWNMPYVNDNSGVISSVISSLQPGDRFRVGSTSVNYTVEDGSGNIDGCIFQVVVKVVTIKCPEDFTVTTDPGLAYASKVRWHQPIIHGYEGRLNITSNRPLEASFTIGDHILIWMASRGSTFCTNCNFTLSVWDIEPPSIQCPEDKNMHVYTGNTSTPVRWESAVATDNSRQDVRMIGSHSSDDRFHLGSTLVAYSVIDESGNMATCKFNVTVTALCSEEITYTENTGELTWQASRIGEVVNSSRKCPIDSTNPHKEIATRQCVAHETLGASWDHLKFTDCGDKVELNFAKLSDVPIDLFNIEEVAYALDYLTADTHSITSHDLTNIVITMRKIVTLDATLPEILLAVINTTNLLLSSKYLRPCQGKNSTVMSTEMLLSIIKSVDHQMSVSSEQEAVAKFDDIYFTRHGIKLENAADGFVNIKAQLSGNANVYVYVRVKESCIKHIGKSKAKKNATLVVYGANTGRQMITNSLREQRLLIVSPLVSMELEYNECRNITVEIPFQRTQLQQVKEVRRLKSKEVKCVVMTESDNFNETRTNVCETVILKDASITCECDRIGVFVAVMVRYF